MTKTVLIISPHPDDETLGAGGVIAKYAAQGDRVFVLTVSGHLPPLYKKESYEITVNEAKEAYKILGVADFEFLDIPATQVGNEPVHILNRKICDAVDKLKPEVVLCPYPDRHIDHRVIFDSAMVATRPVKSGLNIKLIAAYETLSETHWNAPHIEPNFTPNWVVDISNYFDVKKKALTCYESQVSESDGPRSLLAIESLATFRGTQAGFRYGEAFHVIRMTT